MKQYETVGTIEPVRLFSGWPWAVNLISFYRKYYGPVVTRINLYEEHTALVKYIQLGSCKVLYLPSIQFISV